MNPAAAPKVPGKTEFERFDNLVSAVMSVPKTVVNKAEAKWKRTQARKKKARKSA